MKITPIIISLAAGLIVVGLVIAEVVVFKTQSSPFPAPTTTIATSATMVPPQPPATNLGACATISSGSLTESIARQFSHLYIQTSTVKEGWNIAVVPLSGYKVSGYCLLYPSDWEIRIAGPEAMNLLFNESIATGTKQVLSLQVAQGDLSLKDADKASYSYEGLVPEPFVDPHETIIHKDIETIGDMKALSELSVGNTIINRYFVTDAEGVYMFKSSVDKEVASSTAYAEFWSTVKQIVSSTRFIR